MLASPRLKSASPTNRPPALAIPGDNNDDSDDNANAGQRRHDSDDGAGVRRSAADTNSSTRRERDQTQRCAERRGD